MRTVVDQVTSNNGPAACPPSLYRRLAGSQYLRHNVLLLGANVLTGVFAYALHPMLGHLLGLNGYGTVAALITLSSIFLTPVQIVATVASKYTATLSTVDNLPQLNDLVRRLTVLLLPAGVGVAILFAVFSSDIAAFFQLNASQSRGVLLLSLVFIVSLATPLNLGVLQGMQRFGWFATVNLLPLLLRLILAVALIKLGFGINGAILGIALSPILAYLVSFHPLRPILAGARAPIGSLRPLWSYALVAAVGATGTIFLYNVDTILAKHFLHGGQASLYAALATIGKTVLFVSGSFGVVMFPKVAALHERGERYTHVMLQALGGVVALSAAVEVVFLLAPSTLISHLFGPVFTPVANQVVWYGLAMLLLASSQVLMGYFLAIGNRLFLLVLLSSCALEVILIYAHHASREQLLQAVMCANVVLVVALGFMFAVHARRRQRLAPALR